MLPWAAHAVVSWAECTWVQLHGDVSGGRNQGGDGAGTTQPFHTHASCGTWQKDVEVMHPPAQTLCLCHVCRRLESWLWAA